jgi:hypothetical protein
VARFGAWLATQGVAWPANLIPYTNVSHPTHINRATFLREIPSPFRILSLEPFIELPVRLANIDLVIAGGPTDGGWPELKREDVQRLQAEAHDASSALFISHLNGRSPPTRQTPSLMAPDLYPDWFAWPEEFRVRQLPAAWRNLCEPPPPPTAKEAPAAAPLAACP